MWPHVAWLATELRNKFTPNINRKKMKLSSPLPPGASGSPEAALWGRKHLALLYDDDSPAAVWSGVHEMMETEGEGGIEGTQRKRSQYQKNPQRFGETSWYFKNSVQESLLLCLLLSICACVNLAKARSWRMNSPRDYSSLFSHRAGTTKAREVPVSLTVLCLNSHL